MIIKETEDVFDVVRQVIKEDRELYDKYHYDSPTQYEEATEHTVLYILSDTPKDSHFYSIVQDQETVAYLCATNNTIWDIGISIKYRADKIFLSKLWTFIFDMFEEEVTIRLYERNHRDINFLIRFIGAKPMDFEKVRRKLDYVELIPEGAVKGVKKHVFFVPLSQILLSFKTKVPLLRENETKKSSK